MNQQSDPSASLASITETGWTRVAPIALAYFFVSSVYLFITNTLLYLLPVIVLQRENLLNNPLLLIIPVIAIVLFFSISAGLRYWFYQYRLDKTRVEIKQGVFKKSHLDLPFSKIQNVKIEQPFYYRFNHFASVELETAGSASSEAKIVAMKLEHAELFKQKIMRIQREESTEQNAQEVSTPRPQKEEILNTRSIADLIIHGITNNRVWIFLGAAAPFYQTIVENIGDILNYVGLDIASYLDYQSLSLGIFLLHLITLVMLIMLFLVSFSVIASVFVFYKYQLSKLDDKYIRRSGLLNKHEVSMKRSRIQSAMQQQDWLDIIIDRANLKLSQNSAGIPNMNEASLNSPNKLIVPSIMRHESDSIINHVFAYEGFNKADFTPVSKRLIGRYMMFPILPMFVAIVILLFLNDAGTTGWLIAMIAFVFSVVLAILRWYRWGYHVNAEFILIRNGLFGKDLTIFSKRKLQQVRLSQTVFMQRYGKASVKFVLASSAHSIPYIDEQLALAITDETLLIVERDKPAWM